MENSCVKQVPRNKFVMIYSWQLDFCDDNRCAAMLMNFFECWHNTKLKSYEQKKSRKEHVTDNELLQYHTLKELVTGIFEFFKRDKVIEAKKLLVKKGVITIHKNPGSRQEDKEDQTDFFLFHPGIINKCNDENYDEEGRLISNNVSFEKPPTTHSRKIDTGVKTGLPEDKPMETVDSSHSRFIDGALSINRPCNKVTETQTENTINNNSNASLNSDSIFPDTEKIPRNKPSENYVPTSLAEWQQYFQHGLLFSNKSVTSDNCKHMFEQWINKRLTIGFVRKIVNDRWTSSPKINSPAYFSDAVMQRYEQKLKIRTNKPSTQIQHKPTATPLQSSFRRAKKSPEERAKYRQNLQSVKSVVQSAANKSEEISA